MKAMVIRQFGPADSFVFDERPVPELRAGHVLIRVRASSVNPIDVKVRSGVVPAIAPAFPAILHGDVAGIVEAVGPGVEGFSPGDEVYACGGGFKNYAGALAELMLVDADFVAPKPTTLDFAESAALPLVAITAWEALIDRANVRPGCKVLIHAGAGGVGHVAIQIAKSCGAMVYTTVSSEDKGRLAELLGADVAIDYKRQTVEEYVREHTSGAGFDVVFDTVGGANLAASFQAAVAGGTVVCIAARGTHELTTAHSKGLSLHIVFMLLPLLTGQGRAHHGQILRRLAGLVEGGRIRPVLDPDIFPFTRAADAHRKLESGTAVGKIVLTNDLG